jgi:hypothetical protein
VFVEPAAAVFRSDKWAGGGTERSNEVQRLAGSAVCQRLLLVELGRRLLYKNPLKLPK